MVHHGIGKAEGMVEHYAQNMAAGGVWWNAENILSPASSFPNGVSRPFSESFSIDTGAGETRPANVTVRYLIRAR